MLVLFQHRFSTTLPLLLVYYLNVKSEFYIIKNIKSGKVNTKYTLKSKIDSFNVYKFKDKQRHDSVLSSKKLHERNLSL